MANTISPADIRVILPSKKYRSPKNTVLRVKITFVPPQNTPQSTLQKFSQYINSFKLPIFSLSQQPAGTDETYYVLIKDLATLCNYPSSYQILNKLLRASKLSKQDTLHTTTASINTQLHQRGLIDVSELNKKLFYIDSLLLFQVVANKDILVDSADFVADPDVYMTPVVPQISQPQDVSSEQYSTSKDDKILISQVFPQYGLVDSTLPLTHATFNTVNPITKLQFYKMNTLFRKFMGNTLTAGERELIIKDNEFAEIGLGEDEVEELKPGNSEASTHPNTPSMKVKKSADDNSIDSPSGTNASGSGPNNNTHATADRERERRSRKPIGKPKKNVTSIDPNSIDLAESILPGQGLIQEFNINHICKVPNYYITTNHMNAAQTSAISNYKKPAASNFLFNENIKMSRNIQQLVFNSDNDSYHHSKYYYFKSYRGPGSGNYKDAALVNRINKIHLVNSQSEIKGGNHKVVKRTKQSINKRYNNSVKGLMHESFTKDNVDSVLDEQRRYTEDFHNIEMLHNNLQFNLLINTYRDISEDTWDKYYQFKHIDFDQLNELQRIKRRESKKRELITAHREEQLKTQETLPPSPELTELYKPDLTDRFTTPSTYSEIVTKLPVEIRDDFNEHLHRDTNGDDSADEFEIDVVPSIKRPIYNSALSSDYNNSETLSKLEVVKLPNANSIGWDNLRKYRQT